jgi:hypothetical protein
MTAALAPFCRFPCNQLVEVALLPASRCLLVQQRQPIFVERPEPVVPGDFLQGFFAGKAGKVETDHPDIAITAGSANARGACASLFRPSPDFIVISCRCRFRA